MTRPLGSDTTTKGIRVRITPAFLREQSDPELSKFVFAYRVQITNIGDRSVQLLSRYWLIVDADGESHEVAGEGVIGVQPELQPGDSHEYSSFCPLETRWGTMQGHYVFRTTDRDGENETFNAEIGRFFSSHRKSDSIQRRRRDPKIPMSARIETEPGAGTE